MSAMDDSKKSFVYHEESQSERLARKSQETPIFPIAIGMCSVAVVYGIYMFKQRGKMSPSVYIMHTRVAAQGTAVAALTGGLIYSMYNQYLKKK